MMAYADHGSPGTPVQKAYDDAASVMQAVADAGVDLDDVFRVLEDEGVQKFVDSWDELTESVRTRARGQEVTRPRLTRTPRRPIRPQARTAGPSDSGAGPRLSPRSRTDDDLQPAAGSAGPAAAPGAGALRARGLRHHRRPGPQEAAAGGLRPGQPRAAARPTSPCSASPAATGGTRSSPSSPARPPRRPRGRRGARRSGSGWPPPCTSSRAPSTTTTPSTSWPRRSTISRAATASAATPRSTCPSRRRCSRPCSSRWQRTGMAETTPERWRRVVVEKPFGEDLPSSRELNELVDSVFGAEDVFRIDHYLGKETVQNLLALRFANTLFEPVWNGHHVDSVQITMAEDVGIGGRADVLREDRRRPRRAAEPPAAAAGADRDGGAGRVLGRGDPHREAQGAAGDLAARPTWRPSPSAASTSRAGWPGSASSGYRQEDGVVAGLQHRDLRGRPARRRDPPLGRGAVLPAHRQAAAAPGHRDRAGLPAGPAPALRRHRHRGAGQQPAGHPGAAGRGRDAQVRVEGSRAA